MTDPKIAPRVSVIMAVYNCDRYLEQAVQSILTQTFSDLEFIIVNDGSSDRTEELLEVLAAKDSRIRLVHQENAGLTKSLNIGLALARGELIARMDGDDIAMPERFAKQVAEFERDPELVLLGTEVELVTERELPCGPRYHLSEHAQIRRQLLIGNGGALTHPAVMFRRAAIKKVGNYDERFITTQDLDLFLRISEVGQIRNLNEVLLKWRQHPFSVNRTRASTWREMKKLAIQKTIDRIGVEKYMSDLFPIEEEFHFPSEPMELAEWAGSNGRRQTAFALYKEALRNGSSRAKAIEGLIKHAIFIILFKMRDAARGLTQRTKQ